MTENKKLNEKSVQRHDTKVYGGKIQQADFSTIEPNKNRINNQIKAENFVKDLAEERKETEKYRNMTIEELREMRLISNSNGRPSKTLTNEKWQKEFNLRKMFITPHPSNFRKLGGVGSRKSSSWNAETQGTYHGDTDWQNYVWFINDVLSTIRKGRVDYVYYLYQIDELLKFHYNTLRTKYCDGYWEVWLER